MHDGKELMAVHSRAIRMLATILPDFVAHLGFAGCESAASGLTTPLPMVADGAADDAAGLGESVSLDAEDLPRKGRLLPSLFHPALSCVAAAEICTPIQTALKQP